jgi:hypothetical protein
MAVEVEIDVQVLKSRRGAAGRTGFTKKPSSRPSADAILVKVSIFQARQGLTGAMIGR